MHQLDDATVFAAIAAVWLLLLAGSVWLGDRARSAKGKEMWRLVMAGMVGLGVAYNRRRGHDEHDD